MLLDLELFFEKDEKFLINIYFLEAWSLYCSFIIAKKQTREINVFGKGDNTLNQFYS